MTDSKTHNPITEFEGRYAGLSNFAPVVIIYPINGTNVNPSLRYRSVEHAYQACKAYLLIEKENIQAANTPATAKRLGRKVIMRPDWEEVKIPIMRELLQQKFAQKPYKGILLDTGEKELIEGVWWHDLFWGKCYCPKHKWTGQNILGQLLMEIRTSIKITETG